MFRLIGMIVVALIIVGAIGYYRGWFIVHRGQQDGVRQVDVTVDRERIDRDKERLHQELHPDTLHTEVHRETVPQ